MINNTNFSDLIKNNNIRIPKIQRDYAQGRKADEVNEIRKNFVHSLIKTVKGEVPSQELDFVYGNERNKAFEPLDGQQRLTTLFLLNWILGIDLKNSDLDSKFTYETRTTSKAFCDELVKHSPGIFIQKAIKLQQDYEEKEEKEEVKEEKIKQVLSEAITSYDWFQWLWKFDPTVQSMLVMLDSLYSEIGFYYEKIDKKIDTYRNNLNNITFNFLDLDDFKMSDELFIKMNARGKQLSDFDIVKSTLEEEIQIQKKVGLLSEKTEENWRNYIDGKWIDFFWQKYASPKLKENDGSSKDEKEKQKENHEAVVITEKQFKKLLLRLISLQILQKAPEDLSNCTKSEKALLDVCYNFHEDKLDQILYSYNDYWLENDCKKTYRIDFDLIVKTINNLIFENDQKKIEDLTSLIPAEYRFDYKKDGWTYLDIFLDINVPNDFITCFYSLIKYVNNKNLISEFVLSASNQERTNFYDWMHIIRNIIKLENNNDRIDKMVKLVNAIKGVDSLFDDYTEYCKNNANTLVINFFAQLNNKSYKGLDNKSLEEEAKKAKLIIDEKDNDWIKEFSKAEQNYYLWGQIRCLLNWSSNDFEKFCLYESKLTELLDILHNKENKHKYFAVIITESDYWKERNKMFIVDNADRDYSLKRYLRDEAFLSENSYYAYAVKILIDKWLVPTNTKKTAIEFLDEIIQEKLQIETGWKKCILEDNSILNYSFWKSIFITENNHILLGKNKTKDSHCVDPCLTFIENKLKGKGMKDFTFKDSVGEPPNSLSFSTDNTKYEIRWGKEPGSYEIKENGKSNSYSTDEEMINYISSIIEQIPISPK